MLGGDDVADGPARARQPDRALGPRRRRPAMTSNAIPATSLVSRTPVAGAARPSLYFGEEHEMLRHQLRRFVEDEVKPKAEAWEEAGFVPRETLAQMGELGFLGIRYPAEYGGSELDTMATVVLAEELGRSTFSGF